MTEKWDRRFLGLAELVSCWSKDPSAQVGAAIIRPDKTICSVGFNGFPQAMGDYDNYLLDREEKHSRVIHAEMNALLFANESIKYYTLYTYPFFTCDRCAVHFIQKGIKRVVSYKMHVADPRYEIRQTYHNKARNYYEECGVEVKEYEKTLE